MVGMVLGGGMLLGTGVELVEVVVLMVSGLVLVEVVRLETDHWHLRVS